MKDPSLEALSLCSCGEYSYQGGWCFHCGRYRKREKFPDLLDENQLEDRIASLGELGWPPNEWNA